MREFIESDLDLHQDLESLRKLVPRFEMPSPSQSRKREYVNLDIDIQIIGVYSMWKRPEIQFRVNVPRHFRQYLDFWSTDMP